MYSTRTRTSTYYYCIKYSLFELVKVNGIVVFDAFAADAVLMLLLLSHRVLRIIYIE